MLGGQVQAVIFNPGTGSRQNNTQIQVTRPTRSGEKSKDVEQTDQTQESNEQNTGKQ